MRSIVAIVIITVTIGFAFTSCSSGGSPTFCDTACMKDTLKFVNTDHRLKPSVFVSPKDCGPDSLIWTYEGWGVNRKLGFADRVGASVHLNKDFVRCVFNDTAYAYLIFNDCDGGRGYYLKIPFDKTKTLGGSNRAINNFDHKFSVADNLVAWLDPGNILIEDMTTGKTASMTFGKVIEPDFAHIHNTIDSVNITATRIWVKFKMDDNWQEKEKKIELQ